MAEAFLGQFHEVNDVGGIDGIGDIAVAVAVLLQQADLTTRLGTFDANAFNVIFSNINELGDR